MTRSRRTLAVAIALLMVVSVFAGSVTGQQWARGEPDISVHLSDNEVVPGSDTQLTFELLNDGELEAGSNREAVTTARGVSVEVRDSGPFELRSGSTAVGTIPDGSAASATQRLVVPDDLEPGEYDVTLRIQYSYTSQTDPSSGVHTERTTRQDVDVTVLVVSEPRFAITDVATDVQPGTSGEADLTIENVGSETARDVRGTISGLGGVVIGGEVAHPYLGTLEPGESRTVTVDAAIADTVRSGETPLEATFRYRDPGGVDRETDPITGSLTHMDAQSIDILDLTDTLSVGYDGEIRGTLRNDGPATIRDGVLVIEPATESLFVEERRFALSELEPNETVAFVFPTDVSGQADAGPRQVRFSIEYSNDGRQVAEVGPISRQVTVDQRQPELTIDDVATSIHAGGTTELRLQITNQRPETLSNVNARLYTDSPLSATSEVAFVNELEPGASAEIAFSLSASGGAMAKTYPVELDFQYETERGDTVLSRTYQHPVEVTEPDDDGGGLPLLGIGLVVVALLVVAGVWWSRRR